MPLGWWNSESVRRFRELAHQFTKLIESHNTQSPTEFLQRMHGLLPLIYAAGLQLPVKPEEAFEDLPDDYELPERNAQGAEQRLERWRTLYQRLSQHIGAEWNHYQEVFDPYGQRPEEPVTGSLADDLADVYFDLERGEKLWIDGDHGGAVWSWQFDWQHHWGEHTTGALRALYALSSRDVLGGSNSSHVDV